jgi:membrane associated rhomboid family serine protease
MLIILPIGHEKGTVRRLPWVTFGIMALCMVAFFFTNSPPEAQMVELEEKGRDLFEFYFSHPYLELPTEMEETLFVGEDEESKAEFMEMFRSFGGTQPGPGEIAELQAELEEKVEAFLAAANSHPYRRWGLIPASPTAIGFLTHMFLHGGWLHLLGNLFILYLAGPFIEDVWGRGIYAGFYVAAGLAGALLFMVRNLDLAIPLIGASGAIAGVMGAFLIRYWHVQIHFFYMFGIIIRGTFSAPAWTMLPLWFVEQFALAAMTDSGMGGGGVAYWAHVGGFAFGVGAGLLMKRYRVEELYINPAIDSRVNRTLVDNTALDQALEAKSTGDTQKAFAILAAAAAAQPGDEDTTQTLWAVATDDGREAEAAPVMLKTIRDEVRHGDLDSAVAHWCQVIEKVPDVQAEPLLLLRLAHHLSGTGRRKEATAALRLGLLDPEGKLTPALLLRIAKEAREIDPELARGAARLALARPDVGDIERAGAEALLAGEPRTQQTR